MAVTYLTSWLTSHYHVWKAAVSGAAGNSRASQYNLADYNILERLQFGGSPWKKEYAKAYGAVGSPVSWRIKVGVVMAPAQVMGDCSSPITSSYAMYHALKDNGVTVRFIAFPVAGHWPVDHPVHFSDIHRVWIQWFDQYLK